MTRKAFLKSLAKLLRLKANLFEFWPITLAVVCITSPISPHVSLGLLDQSQCHYVGARGFLKKSDHPCPLVAVIDTRSGDAVSW